MTPNEFFLWKPHKKGISAKVIKFYDNGDADIEFLCSSSLPASGEAHTIEDLNMEIDGFMGSRLVDGKGNMFNSTVTPWVIKSLADNPEAKLNMGNNHYQDGPVSRTVYSTHQIQQTNRYIKLLGETYKRLRDIRDFRIHGKETSKGIQVDLVTLDEQGVIQGH